jgi:hypothetical protein
MRLSCILLPDKSEDPSPPDTGRKFTQLLPQLIIRQLTFEEFGKAINTHWGQ